MFDFVNSFIHLIELGIWFMFISFMSFVIILPIAVKVFAMRLGKAIVQEGVRAYGEIILKQRDKVS